MGTCPPPPPPPAPHGLTTDPPKVMAPNAEPDIWFHDLPALATLRGTSQAHVASGVRISQEGEASILLSYVRSLAEQPRV